jgi:uncharacterized membrane protein YkvA (DUF1232 family)
MSSSEIPSAQQKTLENELFNRASRVTPQDAERAVGEIPDKIASVVNSVNQKTPSVKRMIENVQMLYEMLRDKTYSVSWSAKTIVVAALLYFISPIDFLPDFIPVLGYIDDAFVISAALNAISTEIDRYRAHIASFVEQKA